MAIPKRSVRRTRPASRSPTEGAANALFDRAGLQKAEDRQCKRGRRKGTAEAARQLVSDVEVGLVAMGLERNRKESVAQVITRVRKNDPQRYGRYSVGRLQQTYYEVRRRDEPRAFGQAL